MADLFHHTINSLQPKLKFETDQTETTPNGLSLSEVQFEITTSKNSKRSFLILREKKERTAKNALFVYHQSAIPKKSMITFIRNVRKRIGDS